MKDDRSGQMPQKMPTERAERPFVSVVVPVFCAGETALQRCLGSLREQTLTDIEILLVDDGGEPEEAAFLERAAAEDERIRLLKNEKNLGPGAARNRGMAEARGDYLAFVDADDSVARDFLQRLYALATRDDLDIAMGVTVNHKDGPSPEQAIDHVFYVTRSIGRAWEQGVPLYARFEQNYFAALYKKETLLRHRCLFGTARRGEDCTFLLRATHRAKRFGTETQAYYYYRLKDEAEKDRAPIDLFDEELCSVREQAEYLAKEVKADRFREEFLWRRLQRLLCLVRQHHVRTGSSEAFAEHMTKLRTSLAPLSCVRELAKTHPDILLLLRTGENLALGPYVFTSGEFEDIRGEVDASWSAVSETFPGFRALFEKQKREAQKRRRYADPAVTVVVPFYRPGPEVERHIASLRGQTLYEVELLYIDDCGGGEEMALLTRAAAEDARIRILRNAENLGPGPSRNRGIAEARGEYLAFVDPDDYVAEDFLERMYETAKKDDLDIVKGLTLYREQYGEEAAPHIRRLNDIIREGLQQGKPLYKLFGWEHYSGLYRREYLLQNGIGYGTGRSGQDTVFLLRATIRTDRFALADEAIYYYTWSRPSSTTNRLDAQRAEGLIVTLRELLEELEGLPADDPFAVSVAQTRIAECLKWERLFRREDPQLADQLLTNTAEVMRTSTLADVLAERYLDMYALRRYGVNLNTKLTDICQKAPIPRDAERILASWDDFAKEHPEDCPRGGATWKRMIRDLFYVVSMHLQNGEDPAWIDVYHRLREEYRKLQ